MNTLYVVEKRTKHRWRSGGKWEEWEVLKSIRPLTDQLLVDLQMQVYRQKHNKQSYRREVELRVTAYGPVRSARKKATSKRARK